ncbi:class II aldolase/adducin family protein [candidate division TA06 bacterium]|uniref:Class II aldolase/adducin family protein n=1 Tax=candidate division TA06 bacterium TaxID=2250710 RepID=A0A933ICB2_UNCT6|nr:class II aldolase/adducin family protein [candidate division TA06 bacterium]
MPSFKKQIIGVCQRLDALGFVPATDGNVSARLDEKRILITPALLRKGDIKESQLLVTDLEGRVLKGRGRPSSEIRMHLYAYKMRPDITAIVHAHPPYATAFAAAGLDIKAPLLPEVVLTVGPVPLAPYATPSTEEVPRSIAPLIKKHQALLLANHGVLTLGKNLDGALQRMERVEHLAKIAFLARALKRPQYLNEKQVKKLLDLQ